MPTEKELAESAVKKPGISLPRQIYEDVQDEVRDGWRVLGQLHLRMKNDIALNSRILLSIEDIKKRLTEAREYVDKAWALVEQGTDEKP